jgi:hypothetical protein
VTVGDLGTERPRCSHLVRGSVCGKPARRAHTIIEELETAWVCDEHSCDDCVPMDRVSDPTEGS